MLLQFVYQFVLIVYSRISERKTKELIYNFLLLFLSVYFLVSTSEFYFVVSFVFGGSTCFLISVQTFCIWLCIFFPQLWHTTAIIIFFLQKVLIMEKWISFLNLCLCFKWENWFTRIPLSNRRLDLFFINVHKNDQNNFIKSLFAECECNWKLQKNNQNCCFWN